MSAIHDGLDRLLQLGQSVGAVRDDVPNSLLEATVFAAAREVDRTSSDRVVHSSSGPRSRSASFRPTARTGKGSA